MFNGAGVEMARITVLVGCKNNFIAVRCLCILRVLLFVMCMVNVIPKERFPHLLKILQIS